MRYAFLFFASCPTRRRLLCAVALLSLLVPLGRDAFAQESPEAGPLPSLENLEDMSLEDLLNIPTGVASASAQAQREAPGVVTIIGREQIVASGARDLMDVLNHLVPGFTFGEDTTGVVGVGFRGIWGFEGRVLVLVNGHEMNETLYLSVPFGGHFLADQIEKVEIIRGPGSAVYGGYAELAVINITTRRASSLHGLSASARYGLLANTYGGREVNLSWGDVFGDLSVSATASIGDFHRSGERQDDFSGNSFSMAQDSGMRPLLLSLDAEWRNLKLGFLYDEWEYLDRTGYDVALPRAVWGAYRGTYLLGSYDFKLPWRIAVTPKVRFKRQTPWNVTDKDPVIMSLVSYDRTAQRWDTSLTATWNGLSWLTLLGGGSYTHDHAWINSGEPFSDGYSTGYDNFAVFGELSSRRLVDVTLGARFEHHSAFGNSFVPRLALTKVLGPFHVKALYAQAFKAPSIENIESNADIKPERTRVIESELGYLLTPQLFISANVFDINIDQAIQYMYVKAEDVERYINVPETGSCGGEVELRYKHSRGSALLSYSFYYSGCHQQPDLLQVPNHSESVLGLANHKVALSGNVEVAPGLFLSPSALFFSGRWYMAPDAEGNLQAQLAQPAFLLSFFASYRGPMLRCASISAGVYNILGQRFDFLQPFADGKPPLRGFDREYSIRLAYDVL